MIQQQQPARQKTPCFTIRHSLRTAILAAMTASAFAAPLAFAASTIPVSVSSIGELGNKLSAVPPPISADGRFVAFASEATNLVANDTNFRRDIFVHDRKTGQTSRVSVASNGTQANGLSHSPALSADGRFVAFQSEARNLVEGDENGQDDIFVHDRATGLTSRVSIATSKTQGNGSSVSPALSANGRYVAFRSFANNLVIGDTNGFVDIFVHDQLTGQTSRVSVASDGTQADNGDTNRHAPALSADGRFVAFDTVASTLVAGDTNETSDVFVHDRQTGQTSRVSVNSNGEEANGGSFSGSLLPSLSADGRFVAFWSLGKNLVADDTNNASDTFVHDRLSGQTTRVSVASNGAQQGSGQGFRAPAISANGRFVAFDSAAATLVPDDSNRASDIFVHDRQTGKTSRVSLTNNGEQAKRGSAAPAMSADGRFVAFQSIAENLVANDTNNAFDIFVRDRGAAASDSNNLTCFGKTPTLIGTSGNDVLSGTKGQDVIVGLGGNDTIHGLGGNDLLCGGSGKDRIEGGGGADLISGGNDGDALFGENGNDHLFGGFGADQLDGGLGKNRLNGGGGADTCINGSAIHNSCEDVLEP